MMDVKTIASPIKQSPSPSLLTMAGPGKIKDVLTPPATKDPPWKRTGRDVLWPCGYFGQNPTPATHSYCQFWEKRVRLQQWIQISSCPSVQHFKGLSPNLEKNHYSWNFLLMKESLPSDVFIFRNWQSIVFHEKKNSGSRDSWPGPARESSETL